MFINTPLPRFNPLSTELPFHFSESVYESILYDGDISSFLFKEDDVKIATDYIYNKLNLGAGDFKVFDSFTDSAGVTHVYGAHMVNDIRIANHQASAHVKNGQVVSFSSSFGTAQHFSKRDLIISEPKATVDFERASATASAQLDIPVYSEFEHALEYVEQPDGNVVYAYKLQLRNNPLTKWVQVWCDATTGEVIQTIDFARRLRTRSSRFLVVIPTEGIFNVWASLNKQETSNTDNFGKGGKGGDAVIVNAIHAYETNSANFFTPVDGKSPVMTMYGFTNSIPNRSGGLDNGIAIHEYVHGISFRLTGGPTASGCLDTKEAQGLSEGWSDVIAMIVLARSSDTATTSIPMGAYVTNNPAGIRSHPYTTDMTVNPLTYSDLETRNDSHLIGEVWASLLWEVYWSLVTKYGFSTNLYDAKQSEGNIVTMQIIIGGMMLQPCNPTFLSARDAIVAADASYYKGANKCEILKAFAKRGLGSKAPTA
ncbi:extracellular metalloproteinase 2 [Batrachochytrium salamandrivorans]|nr:extracellular metalloproteinase 2 [Batrachochytrium salamandrivorans]